MRFLSALSNQPLFVRGSADEDLNVPDKKTVYNPPLSLAHRATPKPMTTRPSPNISNFIATACGRRDEDRRVESGVDAERFIEDVGFANTLTDARRAGPSLYIAVCGGDVSLPRSIQKEAEGRRDAPHLVPGKS